MGVDKVVFPERDMGIRVAHNLISSNILDFIELSDDYGIAEIEALPVWVGKTLIDLDSVSYTHLDVYKRQRWRLPFTQMR